ncbi:MAG: CDP-diacylglycerol--serine O-phosphatidyltransferase [Gemmatimonadaceae bacterium]|nr:CDP-diacylglycerol--serine O-phosphatidyltransferase [Gemmatimonadaceae bacterium]
MRRAVVVIPSGLTIFNLFFGVFAIIAASRAEFVEAGVYVLLGGICDALDGRVARATNAGSQFGEELDSLVDAITFGLAPAMIMYFAVLNHDGWDWVWVFVFAACAVIRLARFNVEQAGTAKSYFRGLPSPAAGITLASYYWFSQSWLYDYGAIANLKWQVLLRYLMATLGFLMISRVPYPVFPRTGFRNIRAFAALLLVVGAIVLLIMKRFEYFFPLSLIYVVWGPVRTLFGRLFERAQPTVPYDLSEGEDDEELYDEDEEFEPVGSQLPAPRRGHRTESSAAKATTAVSTRESSPRRERAPRADRAERPERTEAERAARREKRDKRSKRDDARSSSVASPPVPLTGEAAEVPDESGDVTRVSIADAIASAVDANQEGGVPVTGDSELARKRKRRRRRGARRERGEGTEGTESAEGAESAESAGSNDSAPEGERNHALETHRPDVQAREERASFASDTADTHSRSPYSEPAPAPSPTPASPPPLPPAAPFKPESSE